MAVSNVQILHKRGNTTVSSTYTGPVGEITIDTTLDTIRIHDGVTAGGFLLISDAQVTSNITAANLGMKGYVDSVASQSIYGNVNVKAYTETMGFQNFSNVNVAAYVTTANSAIIGYIDRANTIQSAQVGAANLAIIAANLGMKGYVDSVSGSSSYSNVNVKAYTETMGFQNFSNVNVAAYVTTANSAIVGYIDAVTTAWTANALAQQQLLANLGAVDLTTLNAAIGVHTGQIAALDANAAVQAGNIAELYANAAAQAVLISSLGNTQQIEANITTLQSNAATQSDLIILINANVAAANVGIIGYVNSRITVANAGVVTANTGMLGYVDSRITVANAGVTAANLGIIGYINLSNTIQSAQIDILTSNAAGQGANINTLLSSVGALTGQISEANLGLKGYVDRANTIQSAQVGAANLAIASANLGIIGYVDNAVSTANIGIIGYVVQQATLQADAANARATLSNTIVTAGVVSANLGLKGYVDNSVTTANIGMKGYVDNQTYSNVQVATFLPTYTGNISVGNINVSGNINFGGYYQNSITADGTIAGIEVTSGLTLGNISARIDYANEGFVDAPGMEIGFRNIPQVSAGNVTLAINVRGKHVYSTSTAPTTLTVPKHRASNCRWLRANRGCRTHQ